VNTHALEPASSLGPIVQSSLRERARLAIRAGVITGEIEAGKIYSAPSLARRLGVSATPVREALLDLASAGLVESVRNRGFRIVTISDGDLDEIFLLRTLLEVPSVAAVAGKLDQATIDELRRVVAHLEQAAEAADLAAYLAADSEFHIGLLRPLGNKRLVDLVEQLRDQQRLFGLPRVIHSAAFMASSLEHREILDAVVDGDTQRAETLMRNHLRHTRGIWAGVDEADTDGAPALTGRSAAVSHNSAQSTDGR
jgi:DNA-binding GntR family transcriptional regulator